MESNYEIITIMSVVEFKHVVFFESIQIRLKVVYKNQKLKIYNRHNIIYLLRQYSL